MCLLFWPAGIFCLKPMLDQLEGVQLAQVMTFRMADLTSGQVRFELLLRVGSRPSQACHRHPKRHQVSPPANSQDLVQFLQ